MSREPARRTFRALRALLGRYERRLPVVYLAGLLGLVLIFTLPPLRDPLLSRAGAFAAREEARWIQRIARGEELLAAGRIEEAIAYFEELDDRFPARAGRHALEKGRERILHALARSHERAGNKRLALEAYRRAVIFDPRNFWNHFALARAAVALQEPEEAQTHFEEVLQIHPSHLPSLRELIALYYDAEDYAAVAGAYRRYLDAFQVHDLAVELGGSADTVPVRVDGRYRMARIALPEPAASADSLEIHAGTFSVEVRRIELQGVVRRGELGRVLEDVRPPGGKTWSAAGVVPEELDGRSDRAPGVPPWAPRTVLLRPGQAPSPDDLPPPPPETTLAIALASPTGEVASLELDLRLLKPVDRETWNRVETSYRSLLAFAELEDARDRSALLKVGTGETRQAANAGGGDG